MGTRVFAAVLLLCGFAAAQVEVNQQIQMSRVGPGNEPAKTKPTAEQLQRGQQMLENAEASAYGMEGGMRAYALLQVAKAYSPTDKKKALELLQNALAATKALQNETGQQAQTRDRLQEQILQAMVPLEPGKADELLDQVEPAARGRASFEFPFPFPFPCLCPCLCPSPLTAPTGAAGGWGSCGRPRPPRNRRGAGAIAK